MTKDTSRSTDARSTGTNEKIGVSAPSDQRPAPGADPAQSLPFCGDFDIRIGRDGTWYYQGSPIGRKALVRLFASVLRREADGTYWLVTPVERGRIVVDDAPFTAVELDVSGQGEDQVLKFRTNIDDWIEAGPDHPIRVVHAPDTGEPSPYILVRDGLEALIVRSVYYQLVELGVEREINGRHTLGVWSRQTFFPLGTLD
ncbi:MAG: DUF1285 domain-containing protein [Alphaproteobacteria bacterium]|nr:MAG: DUF1285 domain-containing protein [Alphaproteobacteria bacterium]